MPFTYDPAALTDEPLYEVRFIIGDTTQDKSLLDDEEIEYYLTKYDDAVMMTAVKCCETIAAKYAKFSKKRVSGIEVEIEDVYGKYMRLAKHLRANIVATSGITGAPWAVTRQSQKDAINEDSDLINPSFRRGMHENPNGDDPKLRSDTT